MEQLDNNGIPLGFPSGNSGKEPAANAEVIEVTRLILGLGRPPEEGVTHSSIRAWRMPWTIACQAPLSKGILQPRILEWVAMPSSRGSSQPKDRTQVAHIAGGLFTV